MRAERLLFWLPVLGFALAVLAPPLNHDVAAVLQWSQRWLAGEQLYVDLIDVNPPLIFILNLLPAWLMSLGLGAATAIHFCVALLGGLSWRLFALARERPAEGPVLRALLDGLPALLLVLPGYDFGQREHLMMLAALPYLMGAVKRASGSQPRGMPECGLPGGRLPGGRLPGGRLPGGRLLGGGLLGGAMLAAVGFALKPHFLAIPALVEVAVLLTSRRLSLVPLLMGAIWLLYLAAILTLFPHYGTDVLPMVRSLYLGIGEGSALAVMLMPRLGVAELLLMVVLPMALRSPGLARMLALAALGAWVAALVQHKGWTYHVLPVSLFSLAAASVLAARALDALGARPSAAGALSGAMALYMVATAEAPWNEIGHDGSDAGILATQLRLHAEGQRVLALSPLVSPIFPAVTMAHAVLAQRLMTMWPLQGAYAECVVGAPRYRDAAAMSPAEAFVFRSVPADFRRIRPEAVVLDSQADIPGCGGAFDFLAYFQRNPDFAETWRHYRLAVEWGRFHLYVRTD
jgi:hypothetical protein